MLWQDFLYYKTDIKISLNNVTVLNIFRDDQNYSHIRNLRLLQSNGNHSRISQNTKNSVYY